MTITKHLNYLTTTSAKFYEGAKDAVIDFSLKYGKKLSALSIAGKMLAVTTLLAIMPMGVKPINHTAYNTAIKLNTQNPLMIVSHDDQIQMVVGESDFNRVAREKQEALDNAKIAAKNSAPVSHDDPSDFRPIYQAAGARFGVPWQLLEAVHQVESGKSGSTSRRSGAGAQGPMQFMPGTWRTYGVDGDGDGTADACNVVDAIYGAANLLASSGAADGDIDGALFNYNHAQWYVDKVKTIAYEIGM